MTRVLMVCMANVCRSPIACVVAKTVARQHLPRPGGLFALFRKEEFDFQSAGVFAGSHSEPTDPRAQTVLERRGYPPSKERSRRMRPQDYESFDLVLAMDQTVLAELRRQCPPAHLRKLRLFLDFAPDLAGQEIPDPYYGNLQGFERVLDLCELGAKALIKTILPPSPMNQA